MKKITILTIIAFLFIITSQTAIAVHDDFVCQDTQVTENHLRSEGIVITGTATSVKEGEKINPIVAVDFSSTVPSEEMALEVGMYRKDSPQDILSTIQAILGFESGLILNDASNCVGGEENVDTITVTTLGDKIAKGGATFEIEAPNDGELSEGETAEYVVQAVLFKNCYRICGPNRKGNPSDEDKVHVIGFAQKEITLIGKGTSNPPVCQDGQKNGDETDIDCGGSCSNKCDISERCDKNSECKTNICGSGVCQPTEETGQGIETEGGLTCGTATREGECNNEGKLFTDEKICVPKSGSCELFKPITPTSKAVCVGNTIIEKGYKIINSQGQEDSSFLPIKFCEEGCDPASNLCNEDLPSAFKITHFQKPRYLNDTDELITKLEVTNTFPKLKYAQGFDPPDDIRFEIIILSPENYQSNNFWKASRDASQAALTLVPQFTQLPTCGAEPFTFGGEIRELNLGESLTVPRDSETSSAIDIGDFKFAHIKLPKEGDKLADGTPNYNPNGEYHVVAYLFEECATENTSSSFGPTSWKINVGEIATVTSEQLIEEEQQIINSPKGGEFKGIFESDLSGATETELKDSKCSRDSECAEAATCVPKDELPTKVKARLETFLGIGEAEGLCVIDDVEGIGDTFNSFLGDLTDAQKIIGGIVVVILLLLILAPPGRS